MVGCAVVVARSVEGRDVAGQSTEYSDLPKSAPARVRVGRRAEVRIRVSLQRHTIDAVERRQTHATFPILRCAGYSLMNPTQCTVEYGIVCNRRDKCRRPLPPSRLLAVLKVAGLANTS